MRGDWITTSGRESLTLDERIKLLSGELFSFSQINSAAVTVFALSTLTQRMKALVRGVQNNSPINLRVLSKVECLAQAWKRGGHEEYLRILGLQDKAMGASGEV